MEAENEANKLQKLQSSRALSQVPWNFLPPLSPRSSTLSSSNPSSSIDKINAKNILETNSFKGSEGLLPSKIHRRSSSDIPLGFSAMIKSSPQLIPISGKTISGNLGIKKEVKSEENTDILHSSGIEDNKDSEYSDNEVESNVINGAKKIDSLTEKMEIGVKGSNFEGENVPIMRHFRSVSMDSFMSPISDANSLKFSLEFGNGEFTEAELRKIMANDKLAEIALSDPKRAKRILANRQSAARSKERKMRYISELEIKVQSLQAEATTLSTKIALLQREISEISNQNNELKFRLQAIEQQTQLKDALNEALTAEVQRLKIFAAEIRPSMSWLGSVG